MNKDGDDGCGSVGNRCRAVRRFTCIAVTHLAGNEDGRVAVFREVTRYIDADTGRVLFVEDGCPVKSDDTPTVEAPKESF